MSLRQLLIRRLQELARDIPYAAGLAAKLRKGQEGRTTLADVIVDVACMRALKDGASFLRTVWERSDGRPFEPGPVDEHGPRRVNLPFREPLLKVVLGEADRDEA